MLPTRDVELVDKSAGLYSGNQAVFRSSRREEGASRPKVSATPASRFLLVEEAQHRLPYARFLYFVGLQASCSWYIVGNRVAFQEGGCVVHLKSAHSIGGNKLSFLSL